VSTAIYLDFSESVITSSATLSLDATAGHPFEQSLIPLNSATYDVEPYYVVDGLPRADEPLGVLVGVEAAAADLSASGAFPDPWDVDLKVSARWLPLAGTFDDQTTWGAMDGDEPFDLICDGSTPVLDTDFSYVRGQDFVPGGAMRLDGTDHFFTDGARWSAQSVTVLMVVVLRPPQFEVYGLLETASPDGSTDGAPYLSMRYTAAGEIQTACQGLLDTRQTSVGLARAGQPIVVGFGLYPDRTLRTVVIDRRFYGIERRLAGERPYDARLFIGRSPGLQLGVADMDILDICYWTDEPKEHIGARAQQLDSIYGVSAS